MSHRIRRLRSKRGDQGSAGGVSLSWLILIPALLLLVFGGIQVGIQMYGDSLIQTAAQVGARSAALAPASAERGRAAAQQFLDTKAQTTVTDGQITVQLAGDQVTVTVTGKPQTIVAGIGGPTTRSATQPIEP